MGNIGGILHINIVDRVVEVFVEFNNCFSWEGGVCGECVFIVLNLSVHDVWIIKLLVVVVIGSITNTLDGIVVIIGS